MGIKNLNKVKFCAEKTMKERYWYVIALLVLIGFNRAMLYKCNSNVCLYIQRFIYFYVHKFRPSTFYMYVQML